MSTPGPETSSSNSPAAGGIDDITTWHRVHPASPFIRGWILVVGFYVLFGRRWVEDAAERFFDPEAAAEQSSGGELPLLLVAAGAIVPLIVIIGLFFASWWFTRYQVTDDYVRTKSGILFRTTRQARLDRVQAIDINQPLLARFFSLAELKFQVADSSQPAVTLAFLRRAEADQLRATLLARAAGLRHQKQAQAVQNAHHPEGTKSTAQNDGAAPGAPAAGAPAAPQVFEEAPERLLLTVPPQRVLGAGLLSSLTLWTLAGLVAVSIPAFVTGRAFVAAGAIPFLIGAVSGYWSFFSNSFNFRVAQSPDGIRLRYGLLETHAQTVPPGRVQAVQIDQPLLWRIPGWYRIRVNVAGYGSGEGGGQNRSILLPVGKLDDVMTVLPLVLPDPGVPDPREFFRLAVVGSGDAGGFTTTPRRARWLDPLVYRRTGFRLTETAFVVRRGRLHRRCDVVPHERTQSLALWQGPLERKMRLANMFLHSTAGPIKPMVPHLDVYTAVELIMDQAARAAAARKAEAPEQWMSLPAPEPLPEPEQQSGSQFPAAPAQAAAAPTQAQSAQEPSSEDDRDQR